MVDASLIAADVQARREQVEDERTSAASAM
jgi:hypothetical protein